jgi:hypothetical protein
LWFARVCVCLKSPCGLRGLSSCDLFFTQA